MDDVKNGSLLMLAVKEYLLENHRGWYVCGHNGHVFHPMRGYVRVEFIVYHAKPRTEYKCIYICDEFIAVICNYDTTPESIRITNYAEHNLLEKIGINIARISAE